MPTEPAGCDLGNLGHGSWARDLHRQTDATPLMLEAVAFGRARITRPIAHSHEAVPVAESQIVETGGGRAVGRDCLGAVVLASECHDTAMRQTDSQRTVGGSAVRHPLRRIAAGGPTRHGRRKKHGAGRDLDGLGGIAKMHVVWGLCTDWIPERLGGEAVVVARNNPPIDVVRCGHRGERLPPDPIRGRFGVEKVAGDKHMAGPMVPRGGRQAVDRGVTRFQQTAANVFGIVPEPSAEVQVRGMDEAKPGHASATPELAPGGVLSVAAFGSSAPSVLSWATRASAAAL